MATKRTTIITCALTGAIHTPSMSPYLPVTPDEIIEEGVRAGAPHRAANSRAHREVGDEVPVHDVHMQQIRPGVHRGAAVVTQIREICGKN